MADNAHTDKHPEVPESAPNFILHPVTLSNDFSSSTRPPTPPSLYDPDPDPDPDPCSNRDSDSYYESDHELDDNDSPPLPPPLTRIIISLPEYTARQRRQQIQSQSQLQSQPEAQSQAESRPEPEPQLEPQSQPQPEPQPLTLPQPEAQPQLEPQLTYTYPSHIDYFNLHLPNFPDPIIDSEDTYPSPASPPTPLPAPRPAPRPPREPILCIIIPQPNSKRGALRVHVSGPHPPPQPTTQPPPVPPGPPPPLPPPTYTPPQLRTPTTQSQPPSHPHAPRQLSDLMWSTNRNFNNWALKQEIMKIRPDEWDRVLEGVLEAQEREKGYDEISRGLLDGGRESQNEGQRESSMAVVSAGVVATESARESARERERRSEARLGHERVRTPMDVRTVDPRRRALLNTETRPVGKGEEPKGNESRQQDGEIEEGEVEDDQLEQGEILEEHGPGSVVAQGDMEAEPGLASVAKETNAYEESRSRQEQTNDNDAHRTLDAHAATGPQRDFATSSTNHHLSTSVPESQPQTTSSSPPPQSSPQPSAHFGSSSSSEPTISQSTPSSPALQFVYPDGSVPEPLNPSSAYAPPEDEKREQQEDGDDEVVLEATEDVSHLDDECSGDCEGKKNDDVAQRETERTQSQSSREVQGQAPPPHTNPNIDAAHATAMQVSSNSSPPSPTSISSATSATSPSAARSSNDVDTGAYVRGESLTMTGIATATGSVSVSTSHTAVTPAVPQVNTQVSQPNANEESQEEVGVPEQPLSSGTTNATSNAKGDTVEDPIVISDDEDVEDDEEHEPSDSVVAAGPSDDSATNSNHEDPEAGRGTSAAPPTGPATPFNESLLNHSSATVSSRDQMIFDAVVRRNTEDLIRAVGLPRSLPPVGQVGPLGSGSTTTGQGPTTTINLAASGHGSSRKIAAGPAAGRSERARSSRPVASAPVCTVPGVNPNLLPFIPPLLPPSQLTRGPTQNVQHQNRSQMPAQSGLGQPVLAQFGHGHGHGQSCSTLTGPGMPGGLHQAQLNRGPNQNLVSLGPTVPTPSGHGHPHPHSTGVLDPRSVLVFAGERMWLLRPRTQILPQTRPSTISGSSVPQSRELPIARRSRTALVSNPHPHPAYPAPQPGQSAMPAHSLPPAPAQTIYRPPVTLHPTAPLTNIPSSTDYRVPAMSSHAPPPQRQQPQPRYPQLQGPRQQQQRQSSVSGWHAPGGAQDIELAEHEIWPGEFAQAHARSVDELRRVPGGQYPQPAPQIQHQSHPFAPTMATQFAQAVTSNTYPGPPPQAHPQVTNHPQPRLGFHSAFLAHFNVHLQPQPQPDRQLPLRAQPHSIPLYAPRPSYPIPAGLIPGPSTPPVSESRDLQPPRARVGHGQNRVALPQAEVPSSTRVHGSIRTPEVARPSTIETLPQIVPRPQPFFHSPLVSYLNAHLQPRPQSQPDRRPPLRAHPHSIPLYAPRPSYPVPTGLIPGPSTLSESRERQPPRARVGHGQNWVALSQAEVPSSTHVHDRGSIRTPEVARRSAIEQAEMRIVDVRTDDQRAVQGQNEPETTGRAGRGEPEISNSSSAVSNESPRRKKRKRPRGDVGAESVDNGGDMVENEDNGAGTARAGPSSSSGRKRRKGVDGGLVEVTNVGQEQRM